MAIRRILNPYKSKIVRSSSGTAEAAAGMALLQVIRWDPSTNSQRIESYEFEKKQDFMVLDLLTAVKAHQDPSLAFRASCCEGVCGSCAMNINGVNSLACVTYAAHHTIVGPLPNFPVIKDLVVDLRNFFRQYEFIRPFVRNINLHRYHVDSIVERYNNTRQALFGADSSQIAATHAGERFHAHSELEAYEALLEKVVAVGDVSKTVEILAAIKELNVDIDDAEARRLIKTALTNFGKK